MVKLYEYEGKRVFSDKGIPVPKSTFIPNGGTYEEAKNLGYPCMVKAQILQGGRGKAGGIQKADSAEEAKSIGEKLMERPLKNERLAGILIEEMVDVVQEMYLGITIDDVKGKPLIVFAPNSGGMDIENISLENPASLCKRLLEPDQRLYLYQAVEICRQMGLEGDLLAQISRVLVNLEAVFHEMDANLVEINPLAITKDGRVIAADSKIIIDDYAVFRHENFGVRKDLSEDYDIFEQRAKENNYILVRLGGNIAVISMGAGLGMAIVDTIDYYGGRAANFPDQIGGKSFLSMIQGVFQMIEEDPIVQSAIWGFVLSASSLKNAVRSTAEALERYPCRVPVHGYFHAGSAALREMDAKTAMKEMEAIGIQMHNSLNEAVKAAVADAAERRAHNEYFN